MPHNKIDIIFVLVVLVLFYYVYLICNDQVGVINMSSSSEWYQLLLGVYSANEVAGVYGHFLFSLGGPRTSPLHLLPSMPPPSLHPVPCLLLWLFLSCFKRSSPVGVASSHCSFDLQCPDSWHRALTLVSGLPGQEVSFQFRKKPYVKAEKLGGPKEDARCPALAST